MPAPIAWNRKPLSPNDFAPLPLSAILPRGWLREAVAAERPQSLDGRLAAAYALEDTAGIEAAGREVNALLLRTDTPDHDALRALMRYHGATGDSRVLRYLLGAMKALRAALDQAEPDPWQAADIGDTLHTALWLYNLTGQKALLALCRQLAAGAPDWMSTFHVFPQVKAVKDAPPPGTDAYARVNGAAIAASLKTPALQALFLGGLKNETAFRTGWDKLIKYHGAAHGLCNADPVLAGTNPSRAVEARTVAELLRTLEVLQWASGDPYVGDLMEETVYGALPAARGAQAANQLVPGDGEHATGMAQFAASLLTATADGGLAVWAYAPCEARWLLAGAPVRIEMETNYPHGEEITLRVRLKAPARFPVHLRVPLWAEGALLDVPGEHTRACEPGAFAVAEREWRDGDTLRLTLPMAVRTARWYHQTVSVQAGPLTFALPLAEGDPWNLALLPERGLHLERAGGTTVVRAHAAPVPAWKQSGGTPAPAPIQPAIHAAEAREITLAPYGTTCARMSQFPVGAPE